MKTWKMLPASTSPSIEKQNSDRNAKKRWNRPGRVRGSLAAASYDIYLYHFPLVIVAQYLLTRSSLPVLARFAVAFLVPIAMCHGVSALTRGRRGWLPAGVAAAFGACLLVWG